MGLIFTDPEYMLPGGGVRNLYGLQLASVWSHSDYEGGTSAYAAGGPGDGITFMRITLFRRSSFSPERWLLFRQPNTAF